MSAETKPKEKRSRAGVRHRKGKELWDIAAKDAPLTRPEIADYLGRCVDTISDYVKQGMPHIGGKTAKKGVRLLFRPSDCVRWLEFVYSDSHDKAKH